MLRPASLLWRSKVMPVRLGSSKDVEPGGMHVFDVAGTKVNVASVAGHLYAFDDTCTHQGCSLAGGGLDGTTVTGPCHGRQVDVAAGLPPAAKGVPHLAAVRPPAHPQ